MAAFIVAVSIVHGEGQTSLSKLLSLKPDSTMKTEIDSLQLLPAPDGKPVRKLFGAFGRQLGDKLKEGEDSSVNDMGALVAQHGLTNSILGCDNLLVFAAPKSRTVFSLRLIGHPEDLEAAESHALEVFGTAFGITPKVDSNGNRYFPAQGPEGIGSITVYHKNDALFIDVDDLALLGRAEEEHKANLKRDMRDSQNRLLQLKDLATAMQEVDDEIPPPKPEKAQDLKSETKESQGPQPQSEAPIQEKEEGKAEVFSERSSATGGLSSLFGVKFGLTIPAERPCETNNLFSLAYKYVPEKAFNEFTDYVIFASPRTRTIYQVRGIHHCATDGEAKAKITEIAPTLEMKFERRLQKDGDGMVMRFPGGDRIEVTVSQRDQGYSVLIDAVSSAYDIRDTEESMALKAEVAQSLVAPLGKTLDEILPPFAARPVNEKGDYLAPLPGVLKANGFNDMALGLLPNTKRVGVLYATCVDNATSCKKVFNRTKSYLQLIFGPVVQETQDGIVEFTANVANAPCRFVLMKTDSGKRIVLVIGDYNVFKAEAKEAAASDLDAL